MPLIRISWPRVATVRMPKRSTTASPANVTVTVCKFGCSGDQVLKSGTSRSITARLFSTGRTTSRGAARTLTDALAQAPALVAAAPDLTIKISGCPNSCGQHHVAAIGLQGGVRKLDGRVVPQYLLHVGGATTPTGARFGRLVAKIPARRLPAAIAALAALVARERRPGEAAADVLHRQDDAALDAALAGLGELTAADVTAADFVDLDDGETRHVAAA